MGQGDRRGFSSTSATPRLNITRYGNGAYSLIGGDELLQLCRQRLDGFRAQRSEEVFAHRCECCGTNDHQRALEVDNIIPRNQGGSDDLSNLRALCFRCMVGNRSGSQGCRHIGETDQQGVGVDG